MDAVHKNRYNSISRGWNAAFLVILGIACLMVLLPVALVVIVSFSSAESIANIGYSFVPEAWSATAYQALWSMKDQIVDSYLVTIAHTCLGTVMSLAVMSLYAYVLAQPSFPCHRFYTMILFFTMLFSGGLVPHYIVNVRYLKMYDSFWIFIFPSLVSAFNVIILRTFIQTTIPYSLFEAARIDGASDFLIFGRIVLPLFKAALATVALFNVVSRWNDWFTGMLYIENSKLVPLQTMLTNIQNTIDFIKNNSEMAESLEGQELLRSMPSTSTRMAIMVVSTAPMLAAYPFFQRYFISGMTIGSVKG